MTSTREAKIPQLHTDDSVPPPPSSQALALVPDAYRRLPFSFAKRHGIMLSGDPGGRQGLVVQYLPTVKAEILREVQRYVGAPVAYQRIDQADFDQHLAQAYQNDSSEAMQMVEGIGDSMDLSSLADSVPETEDLMEQEDDAPIIRLINAILTEAIKESASDIHIETFEKHMSVRMRVDGVLREVVQPKRALASLLVSRIKVMAKLDIAEKRVPQDGRISLKVGGKEVDVRVSTMPSSNGERVVLRILDKNISKLEVKALGLARLDEKNLLELIKKPHGIILVTGPTGSGKTTTLYSCLSNLNTKARNILTVEDPIEYQLDGIGQTQVSQKVDMTFARGLRAILRQDPDVVMVGEIRDLETAEISVQASLTGHLVFSTLHTNTAVGAVTRLHDMGIEPFLLSSSLLAVVAQRLVRVLCPACRVAYDPDESEQLVLKIKAGQKIYRAKGCDSCNYTGYKGRSGIYELIMIDDKLRTMIHDGSSEMDLEAYARTKSPGIRDHGRVKVMAGETTLEEVLRVTRED